MEIPKISNFHDLSFKVLLVKNNSVILHQIYLHGPATDTHKSKNGMSPEIMDDIFNFVDKPYDLQSDSVLQRKRDNTAYFESDSLFS